MLFSFQVHISILGHFSLIILMDPTGQAPISNIFASSKSSSVQSHSRHSRAILQTPSTVLQVQDQANVAGTASNIYFIFQSATSVQSHTCPTGCGKRQRERKNRQDDGQEVVRRNLNQMFQRDVSIAPSTRAGQ